MSDDAPRDPDPYRLRIRSCGLDLLDASAGVEDMLAVPSTLSAAETIPVIALVARARRLLRAAFLLTADDLELESAALRRTLVEYVLRVRWLLAHPDVNLKKWRRDDVNKRIAGDADVRATRDAPVYGLPRKTRREMQTIVDALTDELRQLGVDDDDLEPPSVEDLVKTTVPPLSPLVYAAYRFDSQAGVHATPMAAEQVLSAEDDGTYRIHAKHYVRPEQVEVDTYAICTESLLLLLEMVNSVPTTTLVDPARLAAIRVEFARTRGDRST